MSERSDDAERRDDDRRGDARRRSASGGKAGSGSAKDDARREGGAPRRSGAAGGAPRRSGAPRAEGDRPRRDTAPRREGDRPRREGDRPRRDPAPHRDGDRPRRDAAPRRDGDRSRRNDGAARGGERRGSRPPQDSRERESRVAEPELPDEVTARDLHPAARNELKTLSKENADAVARHLAMASRLIDDDPAAAHAHAQAAVRRAGRVAVVRETAAITAYAIGDYALALRELRTYRRISGRDDQIALIVDSERGVGRPERAIEEGRGVDRAALPTAARVHLAIALSGARLDLGQPERALRELDIPELDPDNAYEWSADLFAARAVVLEELSRDEEAAEWARRAAVAADVWDAMRGGDEEVVVFEEEVAADDAPASGQDQGGVEA